MSNLPRAGLPPAFHSWAEYQDFLDTLVRTKCIDEPTKIWWDVRPSPKYPTVEFRFADICTRVDEAICIAALTLAIVAKLILLRRANITWRTYRRNLISENKWRAARYGTHAQLIDFGKREEVPLRALVEELLAWVDEVVDELGIRGDVEYARKILDEGTSADRQLAVYEESGDLRAVVDHLVAETRRSCGLE
jgi:carboxylate-amine ligase